MAIIKLDLVPGNIKPVLRASQYDDGRQWPIEIYNDGVPFVFQEGDTVELNLRKGDGLVVTFMVAVQPESNSLTLVSTQQMCAIYGSNLGELKITSNGALVGSCNFILEVEQDPTGGDIQSRSQIWDLPAQVEAEVDDYLQTKSAKELSFDNTGTDLSATNTEDAIKEVNTKTNQKADAEATSQALATKADMVETEQALATKADKADTYTKAQVNALIDELPEPMIFKGTLGVGGTIEVLPAASASNEGWTYKVITDGTYAGQTAKAGDLFTSNGSEWVLIPSADEDNDTWRAIKVNGVEKLGNGISSGNVDLVDTTNVKAHFDDNGNKISFTLDGIDTSAQVDEKVAGLIDDTTEVNNKVWSSKKTFDEIVNILPTGVASGSIANFNTSLALPMEIEAEFGADVGGVSEIKFGYADFNQLLQISRIIASTVVNDVTITNNGDGSININGTASASILKNIGLIGRFKQNHIYYLGNGTKCSFTDGYGDGVNIVKWNRTDDNASLYLRIINGTQVNEKVYLMCFDLTQMFGSNIDDYIYTLEQNTAGSGVALIKQLLPKNYYNYNIGGSVVTLNSVNGEYTCPAEIIFLGSTYYNGGKVAIDKDGHRKLTADGQTIDLTDGEPITALVGTNNVYADSGDVSVTYKKSIDDAIAELQALILG